MTMKVFLTLIFALSGVIPVLRASADCANDEKPDAITVCTCNSALYTSKATPPPTVTECNGGNIKISIPKCQLERSKFNSSDLHLNSKTPANCLGQRVVVNNISTMVLSSALSSGACGTIATSNQTHITYSNTLFISPSMSIIITRGYYKVNFSCTYPLKSSIALNSTLHPLIGMNVINLPGLNGNGEFTVTMQAFVNEDFTVQVGADTVLKVESIIYISVLVYDLDANNFAVKVTGIFATPSPDSTTQYDLLRNGCPAGGDAEGLVSVKQNGNGTEARFAMKVFKIANSDFVNLSANVTICNGTCVQDCGLRSLASEYSSAGGAIVSLSLTADSEAELSSSTLDRFSLPSTLSLLLLSLLFVKLM